LDAPSKEPRRRAPKPSKADKNYDPETKATVEAADEARQRFDEVDREVRDVEDKIKALEKDLERVTTIHD